MDIEETHLNATHASLNGTLQANSTSTNATSANTTLDARSALTATTPTTDFVYLSTGYKTLSFVLLAILTVLIFAIAGVLVVGLRRRTARAAEEAVRQASERYQEDLQRQREMARRLREADTERGVKSPPRSPVESDPEVISFPSAGGKGRSATGLKSEIQTPGSPSARRKMNINPAARQSGVSSGGSYTPSGPISATNSSDDDMFKYTIPEAEAAERARSASPFTDSIKGFARRVGLAGEEIPARAEDAGSNRVLPASVSRPPAVPAAVHSARFAHVKVMSCSHVCVANHITADYK